MDLLEEFLDYHVNPPEDVAKRILFAIFHDLTDRGGIGGEWDMTEEKIQNQILESNLSSIRKELAAI